MNTFCQCCIDWCLLETLKAVLALPGLDWMVFTYLKSQLPNGIHTHVPQLIRILMSETLFTFEENYLHHCPHVAVGVRHIPSYNFLHLSWCKYYSLERW